MRDQRIPASGHVRLVHRDSGPQYYVKYRFPDGTQKQKRLGPAWTKRGRAPETHLTKRDAEAELHRLLDAANEGKLPEQQSTHTFRDACDGWLAYVEHEKRIAVTTLSRYRNTVNCRLAPHFGDETPIGSITTDDIDNYRSQKLTETQLAPRTILQDLAHLSGIFKWAKRKRWIAENPYDDAERLRVVDSGDFNVLSVQQVEAVARAAATTQEAALLRVAAYTGLRLGELRALRWMDVDFAGRTLHVRRNLPVHGDEKAPKSKRVRSVPLIDLAARALDELSRRDELTSPEDRVFLSPTGRPIHDGAARDGFYEALRGADLAHLREREEPIVFHDLRHTFGTLAVQVWPIADVQAYMGHAHISTTMIYVHHVPRHDAADRFSRFVEEQISDGLANVVAAA